MCVINNINKILSLHRAKGDPKFLNSEVITLYIVPKKFCFNFCALSLPSAISVR